MCVFVCVFVCVCVFVVCVSVGGGISVGGVLAWVDVLA